MSAILERQEARSATTLSDGGTTSPRQFSLRFAVRHSEALQLHRFYHFTRLSGPITASNLLQTETTALTSSPNFTLCFYPATRLFHIQSHGRRRSNS